MRKFRSGRIANDSEIEHAVVGTRRRLMLSVTALAAITSALAYDPHPPAAISLLALFLAIMVITSASSIRREKRASWAAIETRLDRMRSC